MTHEARAHQLRFGRFSQPQGVYLVTTVTLHRAAVFADFNAARKLVRILHRADIEARAHTLAHVVMPDHLHWLMQLVGSDSLSQCVQRMKSLSTKALGLGLWQKGFHDRALRHEDDLAEVARYVVSNPVRAGLVSKTGAYSHWDAIWV